MQYYIYTDGGCSGNRRDAGCPGAWAYIICDIGRNQIESGSGTSKNTTNNMMELQAVIEGLSSLLETCNADDECTVYTDSKYIVDNFTEYIEEWVKHKWRKASGGPVINMDLWKTIYEETKRFKSFQFVWVKGHGDNKSNQKVDQMVRDHLYPVRGGL
jgi:ribonuclease HI